MHTKKPGLYTTRRLICIYTELTLRHLILGFHCSQITISFQQIPQHRIWKADGGSEAQLVELVKIPRNLAYSKPACYQQYKISVISNYSLFFHRGLVRSRYLSDDNLRRYFQVKNVMQERANLFKVVAVVLLVIVHGGRKLV